MDSSSKIVVDVGNTRMKWGRCAAAQVREIASLPADDPASWQEQLDAWQIPGPMEWAVSGVDPHRRDRFVDWLNGRGDRVAVITSPQQLPLEVALPQPERVGIDRLLNAVAVNTRRAANVSAIIVDAGSAVTVDVVDGSGIFRGGAILPGLRLMARALHDHTALLPLVEVDADFVLPATSTAAAMKAGIFCAVAGAIREIVDRLSSAGPIGRPREIFAGGGDAPLLAPHLPLAMTLWPQMTLEGLRIASSVEAP